MTLRKISKEQPDQFEFTQENFEEAKKIIKKHKLEMKLSSVEFQADETKASFYYTSENRVDFRELIKELYREFNIRVEMKQIGIRQEASKIGGIGSCGRELCCSTWMTSFPSVSTAAARYQQLAINPQKISGQCGRLKCCLNFELDAYTDALKDFPNTKTFLNTKKGKAKYFKMDVFKRKMWYFYTNEFFNPIPLSLKNVNQIISLNKKGEIPEKIEDFMEEQTNSSKMFINATGEDSINRFDKPKNKKRSKKNKKPKYKKQKN